MRSSGERVERLRGALQDLGERSNGFVALAGSVLRTRPIKQEAIGLLLQRGRLSKELCSGAERAMVQQEFGELRHERGIFARDLEQRLNFGGSFFLLLQADVVGGEDRKKLRRALCGRDLGSCLEGGVKLSEMEIETRQGEMRCGVLRTDLEGIEIGSFGGVVFAVRKIGISQVAERFKIARIKLQRLVQSGFGIGVARFAEVNKTEQRAGLCGIRILGEKSLQATVRGFQFALADERRDFGQIGCLCPHQGKRVGNQCT